MILKSLFNNHGSNYIYHTFRKQVHFEREKNLIQKGFKSICIPITFSNEKYNAYFNSTMQETN